MSTHYRLYLRDIINDYYLQFKKQTRKCFWLSAFVPSEIVQCFDVDIFYPESYAAMLAVRNISSELISIADSSGFNESICSYMRIFNGALEFKEKLPFGKIPKPDALIATNNQCGTLLLMWKLLAERYDVPLFIIDFPANNEQTGINQYLTSQLNDFIHFLEAIVNHQLDVNKLKENVINSSKISSLWWKLCDEVFREKKNISLQILTNNFFFPIVCAHCDIKTVKFLEDALNRICEKVEVNNNDYKRIYWWGYPFWFSNEKFPKLSKFGSKIIANNYLSWWCIPINTEGNIIENIAKSYLNTYLNRSLKSKLSEFEKDYKRYNIDGVIVHSNSSCKRDSVISKKIVSELTNQNIPTIEIEGDMCDKNKFQEKQAFTRIEAFLEII